MGFSFTATARCDKCGEYLSSSDETCDHNDSTTATHVFRRLSEGRESVIKVESTAGWKWYALKEAVEDDWIAYQYIGEETAVEYRLQSSVGADTISGLPAITMSLDAPDGVEEHEP